MAITIKRCRAYSQTGEVGIYRRGKRKTNASDESNIGLHGKIEFSRHQQH